MWLTLCTALVGCIPEGPTKRWMVKMVLIQCFNMLSSALSSVINYHNIENRPLNGICVANHTSPIDVLMLMCDSCYSLVSRLCPFCGMPNFCLFSFNQNLRNIWYWFYFIFLPATLTTNCMLTYFLAFILADWCILFIIYLFN